MKEKIKRIINLIFLTIVAVIVFIFVKNIPSILIGKTQSDTIKQVIKTDDTEIEALAPGAAFELNEGNVIPYNGYWRVLGGGAPEPLYCVEKGARLNGHGETYEAIDAYAKSKNNKETGWVKTKSHVPMEKYISRAYYFPDGTRKATDYEAFVLSWPDLEWNSWSGIKQEAIWDTVTLSSNKKVPKPTLNGLVADALGMQAAFYDKFINEVRSNGGTMAKGDLTNKEKVETSYNETVNEYVVGPFKINYVQGNLGIIYGGIKNMYVIGEQTLNIPIEAFIINGQRLTPSYFKTVDSPPHYVAVEGEIQGYPGPNEEFYVVIKGIKDEQINKLHIDFEWMEADATIQYYSAKKYKNTYTETETEKTENEQTGSQTVTDPTTGVITTTPIYEDVKYYNCKITNSRVIEIQAGFQRLMSSDAKRMKKTDSMEINIPNPPPPPPGNLQIRLAGYVWEDEDNAKQTEPNGIKDNNEKTMGGVEVILRDDNGKLVTKNVYKEYLKNPYITGEDGYYEFNALDSKKKYYIEFVYDGQIYQATEYNKGLTRLEGLNKDIWQNNGKEKSQERLNFNNHFAEINSAPGNYTVRRPLYYSEGSTNTAWIIEKYSSEYGKKQGWTDEEFNENCTPYGIKEVYDHLIKTAIEIGSYSKAYDDTKEYFLPMFNEDEKRLNSILQFIEDCRISAYAGIWDDRTQADDAQGKYYPIWDKFNISYNERTVAGVRYRALYPSHLNINFGLNRREKFDMSLRKDVEKATIEINGKVHTYNYDTRSFADETDDGTWDISVRLSDGYYNTKYSREIFGSDYQYKVSNYGDNAEAYGKTKADELNVYVTYKLTVRNRSQSILGEIMEIVDYYDQDYEYIDERSYIQIKNGRKEGSADYQEAIEQNIAVVQTNQPVVKVDNSKYGEANETNIDGYDKLYIHGLQGKKLTSGQTAYIYLTFRVKKDLNANGEEWIRLDETIEKATAIGVGKENIAEINGFKTYYRKGTNIPNVEKVPDYNKPAGLFDRNSVPGNINPDDVPKDGNINYQNFENDTDKAPNIRLIIYRENGQIVCRSMDGIVWEDERTDNEIGDGNKATVGNGIYDNGENQINGVTVQLVELMDNGTQYVWKTFSSGQGTYDPIINLIGENGTGLIPNVQDGSRGKYVFKSYPTGNFVVRFTYGDTEKTVLVNKESDKASDIAKEITKQIAKDLNNTKYNGQNDKSYNGQDYKSTTYQEGINQNLASDFRKAGVWKNTETNLEYIWRKDSTWQNGIETLGEEIITVPTFKPDASNNETVNKQKNESGYLYDITASDTNANVSDAKDIASRRNQVNNYSNNNGNGVTNGLAEILASHEKMPMDEKLLYEKYQTLIDNTKMVSETGLINTEVEYDSNNTNGQVENNETSYEIKNINLGLEERPKAQLSTNKKVTNVKLTLADGSTLFDATTKATNVLWRHHKEHEFKYKKDRYELMLESDPMVAVRDNNTYDAQYGLVQLTMDEELMHGATIKISYEVTITNKGEVDYKENSFYYTGKVSNPTTVVKTEPNQVIDYVANNLQFYKVDNDAWEVIKGNELIDNGLVNKTLESEVDKYNTIITTNSNSNISKAKLLPEKYNKEKSAVTDELVLTQLITSENKTDDLTYRNIVEVVKTSNDVGRRMAYSVVGNQNPTKEPSEVDTDVSEIVKILPPYGNSGIPYIIATITLLSSVILIIGIIFIKKKVLR